MRATLRNVRNLVVCLIFFSSVAIGQSEAERLDAGQSFERELQGGEAHTYQVKLLQGQFLFVDVVPRSVDITLSFFSPENLLLHESDDIFGSNRSTEVIYFVATSPGDYKLEIRSPTKASVAGLYKVRTVLIRKSGSKDNAWAAGWKAFSEGAKTEKRGGSQDLRRALERYDAALQLFRKVEETDAVAIALSRIGLAHVRLGNYLAAIESFSEALKIFEGRKNNRETATSLLNLAHANLNLQNFPSSVEYYKRVLDIVSKSAGEVPASRRTTANFMLGNAYSRMGNHIEALFYQQKALEELESTGDPEAVSMLVNIGVTYSGQGNFPLAMEYFKRSYAGFESLNLRGGMNAKSGMGTVLLNIGNVFLSQGDYVNALEHYQNALKLFTELNNSGRMAQTYGLIGRAYLEQNDTHRALEFLQKAIELGQKRRPNQSDTAGMLLLLADANAAKGNHLSALEFAGRAALLAENQTDLESLLRAKTQAVRFNLALGQMDQARQASEEAIKVVEILRSQVAGGDDIREQYFSKNTLPYFQLVDVLIKQNKIGDAFAAAERAKSRVLLDVLVSGTRRIAIMMTDQQQEQEERIRQELTNLNNRISIEKKRETLDGQYLLTLEDHLRAKRLEFDDFRSRLYSSHPQLKVNRAEMRPISLDETAVLLADERTAIAEYVVTVEKTFLFVLVKNAFGRTSLKVFAVDVKYQELAKRVVAYREMLAGGDLDFQKQSREFYDLLLKPAQALLGGRTNLIVVPDGPLWDLPFQALQDGKGQYLVEQASISYAPSLTALKEMSKNARARKADASLELLAFGNPVVGKETAERVKRVFMSEKLEPIPEAERLVNELGKMYGANRSKVFVGEQAREETAKAESPKYRIVQFATHGILNNVSPMYSHLVLAQNDKDPNEDGLLEAWELKDLDLKADMIILSACETARGRISAGEGMIGMTWASFIAGAPTTVASQWKVESSSTTELMLEFHRQLLAKKKVSKAEALRRASLKLMKMPKYRHPSYWAGFVLVGDGS